MALFLTYSLDHPIRWCSCSLVPPRAVLPMGHAVMQSGILWLAMEIYRMFSAIAFVLELE